MSKLFINKCASHAGGSIGHRVLYIWISAPVNFDLYPKYDIVRQSLWGGPNHPWYSINDRSIDDDAKLRVCFQRRRIKRLVACDQRPVSNRGALDCHRLLIINSVI
jgi:hypothetical protein